LIRVLHLVLNSSEFILLKKRGQTFSAMLEGHMARGREVLIGVIEKNKSRFG
jgi:hypothetical protein